MLIYLGALFFAVAFTVGGIWSIRRGYGENVATGLQRAQVVILEDGSIEGSCKYV